jgi:bifunctional non-homologous end joining protein LigD
VTLKTYSEKRDFNQTSEPKGDRTKTRARSIFVIHEHHASVMHFDLRLEIGGTLKSWSVPKGPTLNPGVRRLAIEVEDHPIQYASFSGRIPEGQYGAGRSLIWDEGTVEFEEPNPVEAWDRGRLSFSLKGRKLSGEFSLVEMKGVKGKRQWLLMKKEDEFADPDWKIALIEPDERFKPEERNTKPSSPRKMSKGSLKASSKKRAAGQEQDKEAGTITLASFIKVSRPVGTYRLKIGKSVVDLTHLEKLYWPKEKITKGGLLRYYAQIGKTIMPHLNGRPLVLQRYPHGIDGEAFFQHNVPTGPAYLKRETLESTAGRALEYAIYTDLASLLYLVNLGVIAQHVWLSRIDKLDRPDYVVFDLDPKGAPFVNVLKVARLMKQTLDKLGVKGFAKTSGSSGIHIFVPVKRRYSFNETMEWAEMVANEAASRDLQIATTERRLAERKKSQIYIDWQQNARGKTIAAAYTVREKPLAPVSAPVTWKEIDDGFKLSDFTIRTMPGRIKTRGDLWKDIFISRQSLP